MLYINKITSNPTVDFAAEELKKYIRMMSPDESVTISANKDAKDGFRLGLMQDFGLDVSDAKDVKLDDIIYIDTDSRGGIIAGSNPRSILIAVYEMLRQNGCRWLFPGVDGEYVPSKKLDAVKYRHLADLRFRGPCLEGSVHQEALLDTIDFMPKVGMNMFMVQFLVPIFFYRRYYNHWSSEVRKSENIDRATTMRWIAMAECELEKRGLHYHAIGHGWTAAPFGIDTSTGWTSVDPSTVSDEQKRYLAMTDGKRDLYGGVPTNTQFCMSSPEARKIVAEYIADYADVHRNVNYLHVWLADSKNNHCECDVCKKKTASDWYMMLLNDIDDALTKKNLDTRIVFAVYTDTTFAPLTERIKNPDRFALMMAPISRSYTKTLTEGAKIDLKPYVRNKIVMPATLDEYMANFGNRKKCWSGVSFCFEYYFWLHQYKDLSTVTIAKRIYEDITAYRNNGLDGLMGCGTQRAYFPSGFAYYVFARAQYDKNLTFDELLTDFFTVAYGEDWKKILDYFTTLGDAFGFGYMEGEESIDYDVSKYYNPERADKLRSVKDLCEQGRKIFDSIAPSSERVRVTSMKLLREFNDYAEKLAEPLILKAEGKEQEAIDQFEIFRAEVSKREAYMEKLFDFNYAMEAARAIIKGRQRDEAFAG